MTTETREIIKSGVTYQEFMNIKAGDKVRGHDGAIWEANGPPVRSILGVFLFAVRIDDPEAGALRWGDVEGFAS